MSLRVRAPMPGDEGPPPRPPGWRAPAFGLAAITAGVIAMMAVDGHHPSGYFYHNGVAFDRVWHYPTDEVIGCALIVAFEALVLILVLRARGSASLAGRAIVLGIATFAAMFAFAIVAMHADRVLGDLFGWHVAAAAWLVAYGLGRLIVRAVSFRRP